MDTFVASGLSVLASLDDLTEQPVVQRFAIMGGTGKYAFMSGYVDNDISATPGKNTFRATWVDLKDKNGSGVAMTSRAGSTDEAAASMSVITGYVSPNPAQTETITGYAPIYTDASMESTKGTMFLACHTIAHPEIEIFNPCLVYLYFHDDQGGVTAANGALLGLGWSIIGGIADPMVPPVSQIYAIIGGFGMYDGANGWMEDDFGENPGLNSYSVYLDPPAALPGTNTDDGTPTTPNGDDNATDASNASSVGGLGMFFAAGMASFLLLFV